VHTSFAEENRVAASMKYPLNGPRAEYVHVENATCASVFK